MKKFVVNLGVIIPRFHLPIQRKFVSQFTFKENLLFRGKTKKFCSAHHPLKLRPCSHVTVPYCYDNEMKQFYWLEMTLFRKLTNRMRLHFLSKQYGTVLCERSLKQLQFHLVVLLKVIFGSN